MDQSTAGGLGDLSRLTGSWSGEGAGRWGEARFAYAEELDFVHAGKPQLVYRQRTRAADDGRSLHAESGFWRVTSGAVELIIAHGIGVAEISVGRWDEGTTLRTVSRSLELSPTAKRVTAVVRTYHVGDDGDVLTCTLSMATDGGEPLPHLESRLHRVG